VTAFALLLLLAAPPDARARDALGPFKKELKAALTQALATSPEAAIDVCAKKAPELARAHSKHGVKVGRSALKLRNPSDAPAPWLKPVMEELAKVPRGQPASKLVKLTGGGHGYAEAVYIDAPCLVCHGKVIAPQIAAKLEQHYPKDEATGFELGDFRGVFWAETAD
jgi:hypothetical protein